MSSAAKSSRVLPIRWRDSAVPTARVPQSGGAQAGQEDTAVGAEVCTRDTRGGQAEDAAPNGEGASAEASQDGISGAGLCLVMLQG
jgi:hypothetical protein